MPFPLLFRAGRQGMDKEIGLDVDKKESTLHVSRESPRQDSAAAL
ncbi:hypothetical protein [Ktedonospora formicarum]|uniref:Uncharacterized protein n=1 Tax=Ktedonospora formicarum TaxID=2778364 RepID=A0A8J3I827_9CHLR|nr:hypothetical protein [Ktedonospora formicarum]GHO47089.1 hypothetical protein KSX_52520 [Ktedonospora formicarum]